MNGKNPGALVLLVVGGLIAPNLAAAHHSFAMFDQMKEVTVEGTVKALTWSNPHVWLDVTVADAKGEPHNWGMETQSVNILYRRGWKPDFFKIGEKVTVVLHPMKDGTLGGQVVKVTFADGRVLTAAGKAAELN